MSGQHNDRRRYYGSGDARDIITNNWGFLLAYKSGRCGEGSRSWMMQMGNAIEPIHLDWIRDNPPDPLKEAGFEFVGPRQAEFMIRPKEIALPFVSHVDDMISDGKSNYPVEVKWTNRWETLEEALDWYMPQIQHHLIASQSPRLWFSVAIKGQEPQGCWVGYSADWGKAYIERVKAFDQALRNGDIPDRPAKKAGRIEEYIPKDISEMIPIDDKVTRNLTGNNAFTDLAYDYVNNEEAAKKFEAAKKTLKEDFFEASDAKVYANLDDPEAGKIRLSLKRVGKGVRFFKETGHE